METSKEIRSKILFPKNIILIGFMGAGKTSVASCLAEQFAVQVVETDQEIVEREGSRIWAYSYLNIGDRFRYHPQFSFPYELYDKSHADGIYCVSCQRKNPVTSDRCSGCNVPLLK